LLEGFDHRAGSKALPCASVPTRAACGFCLSAGPDRALLPSHFL
jgi:hypothetical protein